MDKNNHLHSILAGNVERIGDWTPGQLQAFIQAQSNDPTQMPHSFGVKSINVADHLVIGGKQFEHAVIPRGVTMGDAKGKAVSVYPPFSGSAVLNQAYANLDTTSIRVFAESFDMRQCATTESTLVDGTAQMIALYVPTRQRLTNLYINMTTFSTGGTLAYGAFAVYGPLAYDAGIGGVNKTAVPRVVVTNPTNVGNDFRSTSIFLVNNGMLSITGRSPSWDVVIEPGIYFVVVLVHYSGAPTQAAGIQSGIINVTPGVDASNLAVPNFTVSGQKAGLTSLPSTLDTTSFAYSRRMVWAALYDDQTKQI